ncbi:hypothetical protein OsJ_13726 [Oryza sativa Japonica Group]|uniref:2,4-dihydroxy-7-methoxy-2H-1,4-benzoxazin-3(4H)-one 2-D-glucosyltransferase n=1 Tax=Oryza sativa subsp. japonica TaxID=39947 RepID=B9FDK3_ORYSJ|nr:hypothetical protein OsJ_13726 [Oryza sativa Japonica Group]
MCVFAAVLGSRGAPDPAAHPPEYRFVAVADGTPPELVVSEDAAAVLTSLNETCAAPFADRLAALLAEEGGVLCVIADVMWYAPAAAAPELGVPLMLLMTSSASSFRTFMEYPLLLERGFLPVDDAQKDTLVDILPPFRVKDLQRIDTTNLYSFANVLANVVAAARLSSGLILNTFDFIEGDNICRIRDELSIPVFAIGPLNKLIPLVGRSSFLPPDCDCLRWLDTQAPSSVLFVSFGTMATIDAQEFLEVAWGLAGTKLPFLWVVRPSLVRGLRLHSSELPSDLQEEINGRGRIVSWAPQEKVLGHPSVRAFMTHNGWNSTIESISEGVPMICRPCFGDQMGNARYVCAVWRLGVEMEVGSVLQRAKVQTAVEKLVNGEEGQNVKQRMRNLRIEAEKCVSKGGSSDTGLRNLVDSILSFGKC